MDRAGGAAPRLLPTASVTALERILGVRFKNRAFLEEALTHKSFAMEHNGRNLPYNERLEFLGDSVLSTAVAHYLFERFPDVDEGKLSQMKSQLVSRQNLVPWAREARLGTHILLSQGETATGGRDRDSTLCNTFEAVLGAVYLDAGYEAVKRFVDKLLAKRKRIVATDYKSRLQEWAQKQYKIPPEYRLHGTSGPDHDKTFEMEVAVRKHVLGAGRGKSKKEAEQAAAREALKKLRAKSE